MNQNLAWYVARAAGLVSWGLLTTGTVVGLITSARLAGTRRGERRRLSRKWLVDLHRFMGGLGTVFVGVHLVALLFDTYVTFSLTQLLVPLASSYRAVPVAWGIVAFYLLLAVELTSLARTRLPNRVWAAVHLASFPLWFLATVHLLTAGTDATNPALRIAAAVSAVLVSALTIVRIVRTTPTVDPADLAPGDPVPVGAGATVGLGPAARAFEAGSPWAGVTDRAVIAVVGPTAPAAAAALAPLLPAGLRCLDGWPIVVPEVVLVRASDPQLAADARHRFPTAAILVASPADLGADEVRAFERAGAVRVLSEPSPATVVRALAELLPRPSTQVGARPQLAHS